MARPISKTTKFILALPRTLSAKEVLSKAKASGHKTSEGNIYRVRRLHGGKKAPAKKTTTATRTPAKRATKPARPASSKASQPSKSDFVRNASASTPGKDVVAKAKAAGLELDLQHVYKIRSRSKSRRKRVAVAKHAAVVVAKTQTNGFHSSTEDLLRAVAAEVGLRHAMEILERERAQVRAVLGS